MKNKILLIDDEAEIRNLLTRALSARGYQVSSAASGAEAKRILLDTVPDLIISDLQLEDTDGLALIADLKRSNPMTEIILLTGVLFDSETIRKTLAGGISLYLEKTMPLLSIIAEVDRICQRSPRPAS